MLVLGAVLVVVLILHAMAVGLWIGVFFGVRHHDQQMMGNIRASVKIYPRTILNTRCTSISYNRVLRAVFQKPLITEL